MNRIVRGLVGLVFWLLAILVVLSFLAGMLAQRAWAHDPYSSWKVPGNPNVSCCNLDDCRPTRAYVGEDGLWRAWNADIGEWLTVNPGALLPADYAGDGRSHLCARGNYVFCFTPGDARF